MADATEEEILPNQTLYINNLNERIKKEELRKGLYALFSQYGAVLDVVALKTIRMRGQAFVVFKDANISAVAMRSLQNFPFFEKPMKIKFAKTKSDIIEKMEGTYIPKKTTSEERRKADELKMEERRKAKKAAEPSKRAEKRKRGEEEETNVKSHLQPKQLPPNHVLFVENLPEQVNELTLNMLFQQFSGFKEVRMVEGRPGIAFVEFNNEQESSVAMTNLQHFQITPSNLMVISYAKK
eukprot:TRINITY_DN11409_c0_g1_i1.p1 TRINITY_DN11409_c0_g1~~TRINITY_DN11409_c0_g1_i1.p1  ORF type:complete len:251 (-),score=100.65 TRINITY_DN11409_c0_g1_i1:53-769(-)